MELQQSDRYARYVTSLGWQVTTVDGVNVFHRKIPFIGAIAKIQRPAHLPYIPRLVPFIRAHGVTKLSVEPRAEEDTETFTSYMRSLSTYVSLYTTHFLPTKTIKVGLSGSEEDVFGRMSQAKRRAVRRARTLGVTVAESSDISDLIAAKTRAAGAFGGITTYGADSLWAQLAPEHAAILLASCPVRGIFGGTNIHVVGGVFLIFWQTTAFYWIAGATHEGKKRFAPTMLVWECMRLAKRRGMRNLDFLGVWDERLPNENLSWKGFTRFKEGFGGKTVYYPLYP